MSLATPAAVPSRERGAEAASQYLTFWLDRHSYAIPLESVAEITRNLDLNRMPHMPHSVVGLLNLRGEVLPVIDMRARLGLSLQEARLFGNILIVEVDQARVGLLVDAVDSVVTVPAEQHVPMSPLLEGTHGQWVQGFLLLGGKTVLRLDPVQVAATGDHARREKGLRGASDAGRQLDEDLRRLIDAAPEKDPRETQRVLPQMQATIQQSEQEMTQVLDRVEAMLASTDLMFRGVARLKQEATMGRVKGHERAVAEMDRVATEIQDRIFRVIQMIQFQDVARQKLERVLSHLHTLQGVISAKMRDPGRA